MNKKLEQYLNEQYFTVKDVVGFLSDETDLLDRYIESLYEDLTLIDEDTYWDNIKNKRYSKWIDNLGKEDREIADEIKDVIIKHLRKF